MPESQLTAEQQAIIDAATARAAEASERAKAMSEDQRRSWGITEGTTEKQGKKDESENPSN